MSDSLCNLFCFLDFYLASHSQAWTGTYTTLVNAKVNTTLFNCIFQSSIFLLVLDLWRSYNNARGRDGGLPSLEWGTGRESTETQLGCCTVNSVIIHNPYSWDHKTVHGIVVQRSIVLLDISQHLVVISVIRGYFFNRFPQLKILQM